MRKLRRIYAITSVLFLTVLAISPLKNHFREWRDIQKQYNQEIQKLQFRVKSVPIHLQQIWAVDLDRIDRCTTCHLGIQDGRMRELPQPFSAHPRIYHDMDKFGCTVCHQGQGVATEFADAHLPSEFWDKPVLPRRFTEASCGQCHINEKLADTPQLNRGRELIEELSCTGCHDLAGFSRSFAPPLDGIGQKVNKNWLVRWLRDPASIRPETKMPNFLLSEEEVNVLADFLMSFKTPPGGARLSPLPEIYEQKKDDETFIERGKTLFREARCISCHLVDGRGGKLAPDLVKIASKTSAQWLYNFIREPRRWMPGVEMPQYGFSEEDIAAVVAYMKSEFIDWEAEEADTVQARPPQPNFYEKGLAVFNQYNCSGCHRLSAEKIVENKGPELTTIGSKPLFQIDFGQTDIPRTLFHYLDEKLKNPRAFGENMRMPLYSLSREEREAIVTALLAQKDEPLPAKYLRRMPKPPEYQPQGEVGRIIEKYACLKCHTINGTGGTIAPDLSRVGSQLQREWVREYFRIPYSLRPIVEERMPKLFIKEQEVEVLLNYFYTVLLDDSISAPRAFDFSDEAVARGRGLFWEKYGCQSCHIVGGKGGYVGPPLDRAGKRLQPGWVYHWLLNPQKYKPDTIEPRTGMSEAEARDLVAYIMSLKGE